MKAKKAQEETKAPAGEQAPGTSFEEEFRTVEGAVEQLERGSLTLEESLREYERGLKALRRCHAILQEAQKRIEVLSADALGAGRGGDGAAWKPAESVPALRDALEQVERAEELPRDG